MLTACPRAEACSTANGKVLIASRDARLKEEIIAGLRGAGGNADVRELQERVISLTRTINDMQNKVEDIEIERAERQNLLRELDLLRDANRALEKKNEDLAASTLRARSALQDVEAAETVSVGLKQELEETQRKLANARQTIVNLQSVNTEHSRSMQEAEEGAGAKEKHYQKIIGNLRTSLEQEKAKAASEELAGKQSAEQQMEALRSEVAALKHENSALAKSVQHAKEAAAKVAVLEEELKNRQQHVLGLEGEIKRQRDLLNQTTQAHAASGQELGESKNIINALQERVSSISAQLHARTSELQNVSKELEEQRELFRVQRQETEETKNEVKRLDSGNTALQQRLNQVEEEHAALNDASQRTHRELSDERQQKDQVLSQALATEKALEAKSRELEENLARVQDMERQISDLTLGVQSKDECLAKMVATRQSLAVEVAAMREDGDYLREQLSEGGNQLQIAHSRILTLEARIRENEAQIEEMTQIKELLKEREGDCQNLALKVAEHQNEKHRSEDMLQLLQDKVGFCACVWSVRYQCPLYHTQLCCARFSKQRALHLWQDVLLHDALRKNTALVSEIEQVCVDQRGWKKWGRAPVADL